MLVLWLTPGTIDRPTVTAGASGALCGLFGAMASWLLLNRTYLPEHVFQAFKSMIGRNVILIVVISLFPGVSWSGHLGGAVAGAIVAVPLNWAHFGVGPQRWLGWVATVAVAVVSFVIWQWALTAPGLHGGSKDGPPVSLDDLMRKYPVLVPLNNADGIAREDILNKAVPVLNAGPAEMEPAKAKALQKAFQEQLEKLRVNLAKVQNADASDNPEVASTVKSGLAFLVPAAKFGEKMVAVCAAGRITDQDHEALVAQFHELERLRAVFLAEDRKMRK
jgi:hypothetical protein